MHNPIKYFVHLKGGDTEMGIIAFLAFIFVVVPVLSVVAGADTWQRNRHNWT